MALYNDAAGKPIQKVYKRIGIRRDRNFSDLSNPTAGLENLLDSLIVDTGDVFLSSDLDAIRNIFARGLTNENYLNVAGSSAKFTTPGISSPPQTVAFDPRITYQNRLDKLEVFTGTPRLAGGNGLTAKYYQNDQINFDTFADFNYNVDPNTTAADVFSGITTEGVIADDNFWEEGDFDYDGNVHPQSSKVNTGVKWEGYFIPTITGKVRWYVSSTGYFTVDFQQVGYQEDDDKNIISSGIGTYTEHIRVGITTVIPGISGASGTNQITVSGAANLEKMNTIGIGMTVVLGGKIAPGTVIPRDGGFDKVTGVIQLEPPSGTPNAVIATISNEDVTFTRDLGTTVRHDFDTQVLTAYEKYRIRIRYFHHKEFLSRNIVRMFDIDYRQQNMPNSDDIRFNRLFSLDYDFSSSAKGAFNIFNDNSIRFGGSNLVGIGNSTNKSEYVKVKSGNKVDITYEVKQSLGSDTGSKTTGIIRRSTPCTVLTGATVIGINDGLTTDIEIGNYVFGTGIPDNARVIEIVINQFVIIDKLVTATGTPTLTFINHRGFVKKVTGSHSGTTITGITPGLKADPSTEKTINTDVQKGMVAIGANLSSYTTITSLTLNSMNLSKNVSATGSADVFIYQSRGLKDNSLQKFCDTFTTTPSVQCLIATAPVTSGNVIPVSTLGAINSGNATNWNIQGFNFASGTKIQSVATNQITLTQNITKEIVSGTQFTATLNSDDRQLCCPPTDTSPPFTANVEGLNTDSVAPRPNLRFENGNLVFDQLTIQNNGSNITDASSASSVNRKIDIQTPSGIFKILATT
jgi:hypothetical protein